MYEPVGLAKELLVEEPVRAVVGEICMVRWGTGHGGVRQHWDAGG